MPRYQDREAILADWLAGATGAELAAKYGCSKTAGSSLAWKRGLKRSAKAKKLERAKKSERAKTRLAKHPLKTRHNHKKVADHVKEHGIAAAVDKFGYSEWRVRSIANKFGWVNPKKCDRAAILRAYTEGMPLAEIAEKFGCDKSYPARIAKQAGMKRRQAKPVRG